MKKTTIFLILILTLSIGLRFFALDKYPIGFYSDEAAFSYNAFSILKTGRDEYGVLLPLTLKSFGDYKAPLYSYFLTPFVFFFGLSEASTRGASATLGVIMVLLLYLITLRIFGKRKLALISAFLIAVSPFALQFNRMVHENNLVVILVSLGFLLFLLSNKKPALIILCFTLFALSIYTYHDARVFTPLAIFSLLLIYRNQLLRIKKQLLLGVVIFTVVLLPFISTLSNSAIWTRPKNTIIFSDLGLFWQVNQERGENIKLNYFNPVLFHNKVANYSRKFLDNYFSHFNYDFLFFYGDKVKIYSTLNNGLLYFWQIPFLYLGLYFLFRNKISHRSLLLLWLVLAPIPAALTRFVPSTSRLMLILPPLTIILGLGLVNSIALIKGKRVRLIYLFFFSLLFVANTAYYLHFYYFNTPLRYAKEWHYGMKEVIAEVKKRQEAYEEVWYTDKAWGYIYPLFYLSYEPVKYQPQAKLGPPDAYGFGWVESFDKYLFKKIPKYFDYSKEILYIATADELPKDVYPLWTINYPDGENGFVLLDTEVLEKYCPLCSLQFKPSDLDIYGNKIIQQ